MPQSAADRANLARLARSTPPVSPAKSARAPAPPYLRESATAAAAIGLSKTLGAGGGSQALRVVQQRALQPGHPLQRLEALQPLQPRQALLHHQLRELHLVRVRG